MGCRQSRLKDSRPQDKSATELKDIPSWKQAICTRQEATSEAKDHLIAEVNELDAGTEATAFMLTDPLLEGEPEVYHPTLCTTCHPEYIDLVTLHWCPDKRPCSGQLKEPTYHTDQAHTYH